MYNLLLLSAARPRTVGVSLFRKERPVVALFLWMLAVLVGVVLDNIIAVYAT